MGEEMAVYSGLNPESIKMLLILTTVLSVSFTVSQVGIIGFVGLIIPHIVRMIKGPILLSQTSTPYFWRNIFNVCRFYS